MAVPMSLIISEASINTILEKGHINIPTVIQEHAWECLWLTNMGLAGTWGKRQD